jgi:hypothetical protein
LPLHNPGTRMYHKSLFDRPFDVTSDLGIVCF